MHGEVCGRVSSMRMPDRQGERLQPGAAEVGAQLRDAWFVADRRERVGGGGGGFGRVAATFAVHGVQLLGAGVVGVEVGVGQRPGGGDPVDVGDGAEVAFAEPEEHRAVELGVAADVVVLLGGELLAVLVGPFAGVAVAQVLPQRLRAPVLDLAAQPVAAFEQQDPGAGGRERVGQRAAAGAGTDDDEVVVVAHVLPFR